MSEPRNEKVFRPSSIQKAQSSYQNRVESLFARVNKIQNFNEEEKREKANELEKLLSGLEDKLQSEKNLKNDKIGQMEDVIKELKMSLQEESNARISLEEKVLQGISKLETEFSSMLDTGIT